MHKRLIIIGARGHGKVVADIAKRLEQYDSLGFLDDDTTLQSSMDIPVLGKSGDAVEYISSSDIFVAIGNADVRKALMEKFQELCADFPVLVHPQAVVGTNVSIGVGTVVMAGAVINPDTVIGKGCIINTCASVDHDCVIEDYVHVAVGAHLAGNVRVGKKTWLGAGTVIKNNVCICADCMVGVGAAVVKDINKAGTYVGIPAKEMYMSSDNLYIPSGGGNSHKG